MSGPVRSALWHEGGHVLSQTLLKEEDTQWPTQLPTACWAGHASWGASHTLSFSHGALRAADCKGFQPEQLPQNLNTEPVKPNDISRAPEGLQHG